MSLRRKQHGATMWEMCLYVFVFLFVVTVALKLGPFYIDDRNIASAMGALKDVETGKGGDLTNAEIKDRLSKNFQVSMINDAVLGDLKIDRTGGRPVLILEYDARAPFAGNIEILVHFKHRVEL